MKLTVKKINTKNYYYLEYFSKLSNKLYHFSKYVGLKKPSSTKLNLLRVIFYNDVIQKLFSKNYSYELYTPEETIKSGLLRNLFLKKYNSISPTQKKKFEMESIILFTLTTLTTEDVNVDIQDVKNAYENKSNLSKEEIICKNMIDAVNLISTNNSKLTIDFLQKLHKTTMAEFETKTPGLFRMKAVHLVKKDNKHPLGKELDYQPPSFADVNKQLTEFVDWYNTTELNPLEKAVLSHYKLYKIHPFLDGNKRICRLIFNKALIDVSFPMLNISDKKGDYFESLIASVEKDNPKMFAEFVYKQYLRQVKDFIKK